MKILVAGDFVPQNRVIPLIENGQYSEILGEVKPIVESVDYSIVNLEAPVINGNPSPIKKNGPNLYTTEKTLDALKFAGFDCVTLANNHFYDQGEQGVRRTIEGCRSREIDYVGGGYNIEDASKILYKNINGKKLAIINCCEWEYSIASEEHGGSCPLDNIDQYYSIVEAKKKADYVLVIVHGGMEVCQLPPMHLVKSCRFFVDAGADMVVCHHQHCYSGFEKYHNKQIVYGLGNFCFDRLRKYEDIWSSGYMASFDIVDDKNIDLKVYPYNQCSIIPSISLLQSEDYSLFQKNINKINAIISSQHDLSKSLDDFYKEREVEFYDVTSCYRSSLFRKLFRHGLLPDLFPHKNWNLLRDVMLCDSNTERFLRYVLKRTTNQK